MIHPNLPSTVTLVTLLICGCGSQAAVDAPPGPAADANAIASEASGETLLAAPPNGWTQIGATRSGDLSFAEYVPGAPSGGEPGDGSWKEKITLERLEGTPVPDPLEFLDGLRSDHLEGCRNGSYTPIAAAEENGYPTAVAMLVCPKLELVDAGQVTLIKVIQGDAAFYTITRAIRAGAWSSRINREDDDANGQDGRPTDREPEKAPSPPVDPTLIGGATVWLRAILVCTPEKPDHPCPGATGP